MNRRPHGRTRFPYTTLFRSRQGRREIQETSATTAGQESGRLRRAHAHLLGVHHVGDTRSPVRLRREVPREEEEDRKSTRLNSSHVSISYAVFCLKKQTSALH